MSTLISPLINLGILIAILVYYLRQPLKEFVSSRHKLMLEELRGAQDHLHRSQEKYEEFSAKLKAVGAEIASLKEQHRQDAREMSKRITAEAQRLSGTIVSDARTSAGGLVSELKRQLYTDLGTKVVTRAEKILTERLTHEDRARIRKEFSKQLEAVR